MSSWGVRAFLLLVVGGLAFAWIPDVDLREGWVGARAQVPDPQLKAQGRAEQPGSGCRQRDIDATPDPSTDITGFSVEAAEEGLLLIVTFRDLLPDVQQSIEFDLRTSRGRDVNVRLGRWVDGAPVQVTIGDAPDLVKAAARAQECSAAGTMESAEPCAGLIGRMDARADRAVVRVPRYCLGNPRWARAGVSAVRFVSADDIPHDAWVPPGADTRGRFGPLGPWVAVSR